MAAPPRRDDSSRGWPARCAVQTAIGAAIPTTIEGTIDSIEPRSGLTASAIKHWIVIAATIPTVAASQKCGVRSCATCMTTDEADATMSKKARSPTANAQARKSATARCIAPSRTKCGCAMAQAGSVPLAPNERTAGHSVNYPVNAQWSRRSTRQKEPRKRDDCTSRITCRTPRY